MAWTEHPVVLEVNTWVWLAELSADAGRHVTLATVPAEAWDDLCRPGVDALWLMGVWERSPVGAAIGRVEPGFRHAHLALLPGYTDADVVGSPYSVRRYEVDPHLGGTPALAVARGELDRRGVALVLDFVPNHVAPDHPWARERPELLVPGTEEELSADPRSFRRVGAHVLACGRDPYFSAWTDVVQVNAFSAGSRAAASEQLRVLGGRCDGLRCDMAMLLLNDVFAGTWGPRVGPPPAREYWEDVIGDLRRHHPSLRLVAEVYWDLEWRMLELGFDACYDKRLYDRLVAGDAEGVRAHLGAGLDWQRRTVRFTENHDEPRAATAFASPAAARAAAVAVATLPGTTLWHEGQFEGRRARLPVLLGRRPREAPDEAQRAFHHRLLAVAPGVRRGEWRLAPTSGWPGDDRHRRLLAWTWDHIDGGHVVVVNLADTPSAGVVHLPAHRPMPGAQELVDPLRGDAFVADGASLAADGLFVDLPAWGTHVLAIG